MKMPFDIGSDLHRDNTKKDYGKRWKSLRSELYPSEVDLT